ncbi:MAG: ISL3 family transposase [Bacteroidota bacterium]
MSLAQQLLPSISGLKLLKAEISQTLVALDVVSCRSSSRCPLCQTFSSHIQSHYHRRLMDAPWAFRRVRIRLRARRFYCRNDECEQKMFTERFDKEIFPYARRTQRVNDCLEMIGFSCGGKVGADLSHIQGIAVSPSTMLRIIFRSSTIGFDTPRVLGVDEWAFRKGHSYGTILVDLEKRKPIDLLPEKSAESFKDWLNNHPGVEIISRDRAGCYAEGAKEGAPDAIQIADRWHLLKNMGEVIERILRGKAPQIKLATYAYHGQEKEEKEEQPYQMLSYEEQTLSHADSIRLANFLKVKQFQKEGKSIYYMSRELGIHRQTVRNYMAAEEFSRRALARTAYPSLRPHINYLKKRWGEGVHSPTQLWRELHEKDSSIKRGSVYRLTKRLFGMVRGPRNQQVRHEGKPPTFSARKASILLSKNAEELTEEEKRFCATLRESCKEIQESYPAIQEFIQMIKHRKEEAWEDWIKKAQACQIPPMVNFVEKLLRDKDAVQAALTFPWSNGQVEGQINRLKNIKRQMYGRAGFELLRRRVLYRSRAG